MIRVTVPRTVADALMPLSECSNCRDGCDVYECCVGRFGGSVTNWDYLCDRHSNHQGFHDCHTGCCLTCDGSGSLPPVLRLLVVEGERELHIMRPPDYRLEVQPEPPASIVRAIEAGERIGLDVRCDDSEHHRHLTDGRWHDDCAKCKRRRVAGGTGCNCTDGRVPVGSVRPVRVLPVTASTFDHRGDQIWWTAAMFLRTNGNPQHLARGPIDLSVYGPAESLVGKFAVEVEDARREP